MTVAAALLAWYDANARVLPWRAPPGAPPPDPYRVWLSEVMLQQTGTATVAPYFARFLDRWPAVANLAAADDAEVMREWAGLGYYARARNLLACARVVAASGWPDTEAGLRTLPGVGAYTAAAVAAIAFGRRAVVVDGNVERVVARLFAVGTPLPAAKRALYALADRLTPERRAGDHAQAMMDLGATVCRPRAPRCDACPLAPECAGRASGAPERFPVQAAKAAKAVRVGTAWWIEVDGHVLLERRPAKGLLGGMLGLPGSEWAAISPAGSSLAVDPPAGRPRRRQSADTTRPAAAPLIHPPGWTDGVAITPLLAPIRHVFTHFELRLTVAVAFPPTRPELPGEWHRVERLPRRRAADALRPRRRGGARRACRP